jgi:hypothetical protein
MKMNIIKASCIAALFALCAFIPSVAMPMAASAQPDIQNAINCGTDLSASGSNGGTCASSSSSVNVQSIVDTIINVFSWVVGVISVIMIIFGGFKYITSSGSSEKVGSAKNTIIYALVGLIIVALAQVIVHFVLTKVTTS